MKRAVAIEMDMQVYDPYTDLAAVRSASAESVADLGAVLAEVDFVTAHCPHNEGAYGMIGAAQLARMRSTAIIVTTARGGRPAPAHVVNKEVLG
ncbi:MAG: hypothetical protein OXF26_07735 [Alphaproteobacteria bacterium]|nr:hypothetical protein [Alphaproteobacteria bacterium]MCY4230753.1 hypothetical protein [Alphaproteobacteria bacterium]MCY4320451.1 hypothetical protein [Alphaproteobacteria bacterium]